MKILKKGWFWLTIILIFGAYCYMTMDKENYIKEYTWNLKDTKISQITFDDNSVQEYKYVVLGVENNNGDLKSGKYLIKTDNNSKASFIVYVTDTYYENDNDIPQENYQGMVQGFDKNTLSVELKKGQYIYLLQNYNRQGKVILEQE